MLEISYQYILQNLLQSIGNCYVTIRNNTLDSEEYMKIIDNNNIFSQEFIATRNFLAHVSFIPQKAYCSFIAHTRSQKIDEWISDILDSILLSESEFQEIFKFIKTTKTQKLIKKTLALLESSVEIDLVTHEDEADHSSLVKTHEMQKTEESDITLESHTLDSTDDKPEELSDKVRDIKKLFTTESISMDEFTSLCDFEKMSLIESNPTEYSYNLLYEFVNIIQSLRTSKAKDKIKKEARLFEIMEDSLFNPQIMIKYHLHKSISRPRKGEHIERLRIAKFEENSEDLKKTSIFNFTTTKELSVKVKKYLFKKSFSKMMFLPQINTISQL